MEFLPHVLVSEARGGDLAGWTHEIFGMTSGEPHQESETVAVTRLPAGEISISLSPSRL